MTTTTLTSFASTYDVGLRHVHFNGRSSTMTSGTIHEGWCEWWVERDSALLTGEEAFLVNDFGWVGQDGDVVYCRAVDQAGNAGSFVSYTYSVAGTPDLKVYVDNTKADDSGNGLTTGTAKKTYAAAETLRAAAQADGVVVEIALKAGQTHTVATGGAASTVTAGLLILSAYDSGDAPILQGAGNDGDHLVLCSYRGSVHVDGVILDGNRQSTSDAVSCVSYERTGSSGTARTPVDFILHNGELRNGGFPLVYQDDQHAASGTHDIDGGIQDFWAIQDAVIAQDQGSAATGDMHWFTGAGLRYVTVRDLLMKGANGPIVHNRIRVCKIRDSFWKDVRNETTEALTTNYKFEWGGDGNTLGTNDGWMRCSMIGVTLNAPGVADEQLVSYAIFTPMSTSGSGPGGYLYETRVVGMRVNNGGIGVNGGHVRNVQFWNCEAAYFSIQPRALYDGDIESIEYRDCAVQSAPNDHLNAFLLQTSGGTHAMYRSGSITIRGCVALRTGGGYFIQASPIPAANIHSKFANCDYNHLGYTGGSSPMWMACESFGTEQTLAQWQSSTSQDADSSATASTDFNWTALGTVGNGFQDADRSLASASGPLSGTGWPRTYAIDADGFLRDASTPDAGPFEFGASTTPDEPDMGGGGGGGDLNASSDGLVGW